MTAHRVHGTRPFKVAVLHGGPGAPGEAAPLARELSIARGILEPLQTAASLDGQVQELREALEEVADVPVTLVGWSWGAMLGFIFAARHPAMVAKLVLVSSGPFEDGYAEAIMQTRLSRLTEQERAEAARLVGDMDNAAMQDKDVVLARFGELMSRADSYDPLPEQDDVVQVDHAVYQNVWRQAVEMRRTGRLVELGKAIRCPVVAIHGDHDPHPAEGVREPLSRVLMDFRFILVENCGHKPWRERAARSRFLDLLIKEIV